MQVTNDYKILTISDYSVIRLALLQRQASLEQLIMSVTNDKALAHDRLLTQLRGERDQIKATMKKVSL